MSGSIRARGRRGVAVLAFSTLIASMLVAAAIPLGAQASVQSASASSTATAHVAGSVTDAGSKAVSGAMVTLHKRIDEWGNVKTVKVLTTGVDGEYSFTGVSAGTYTISVTGPSGSPYIEQWWGGSYRSFDADFFVVATGAALDCDVALAHGGSVAGTVTGLVQGTTKPLSGQRVDLESSTGDYGSFRAIAFTDGGAYRFDGVPAGEYVLTFGQYDTEFLAETAGNRAKNATPVPIVVKADETNTQNAELARGARVTGTVVGPDGKGLAGVVVRVINERYPNEWNVDTTDAAGKFRVAPLPAGTFDMTYSPDSHPQYADWTWNPEGKIEQQASFTLGVGQSVVHDAKLFVGRTISGKVSVPSSAGTAAGIAVTAYAAGVYPPLYVASTTTDARGAYKFVGLPRHSFNLEFRDQAPASTTHRPLATVWWGASSSASSIGTASTVYLRLKDKTDANVSMYRGGEIHGTISVIADGVKKTGGDRFAVSLSADGEHAGEDYTDSDGRFEVTGLPSGTQYKLSAGSWSFTPNVAPKYWPNATSSTTAGRITVTAGKTTSPIDMTFTVPKAVTIGTPTIAGTARVGSALKASVSSMKPADATITYQWLADGQRIAGATSSTFTLTSAQADKQVSVTATGRKSGYQSSSSTSTTTMRVMKTAKPSITGALRVGGTLSVAPNSWSPAAAKTYQWYAGNTKLAGETASTLVLTSAMLGRSITVNVTGAAVGYSTLAQTSSASPKVTRIATPTISGTPVIGQTLTARTGSWRTGTTFSYQWYSGTKAITGATTATLTVPATAEGAQISVRVKGILAGYATITQPSAPTTKVVRVAVPGIAGSAAVGSTLTASTGAWTTGEVFTYQWSADGVAIGGATATSYVPAPAVIGKALTVTVTGRLAGYPTVAQTSTPTAKVALTAIPTISGTARVGGQLTASVGTWTSGTTLTTQWLVDGLPITGETGATLTLGPEFAGTAVSVQVTGVRPGYATITETSTPTAKVVVDVVPTIAGDPVSGTELTVDAGDWTAGTEFGYQWFADGMPIDGATAAAFTVTDAQIGTQLTVIVTGTQAGFASSAQTSAATAKVARIGVPTIEGIAEAGQTLTAVAGEWTDGTHVEYQWFRDDLPIDGATEPTLVLTDADIDATVRVAVTGSLDGFPTVTALSEPTAIVSPGPAIE
ncbi:MAG: carboxypeptidase regulatory-like domain-containing protein [Microbacterium sp.]